MAPDTSVKAVPGDRQELRAGSSLLSHARAPSLLRAGTTPAKRVAPILLGAQLIGLLVFSTIEYQSFALGRDFAAHAQAWLAIAHGNLDPWSSLYGSHFWKGNSEFLTWPLALLYFAYPHSVDLLWVQDVAVIATEVVTLIWISEVLQRHPARIGPRLADRITMAAAAAMVVNPWCYETIAFDYHSQALTTLFAVLALRSLWSGRNRQLFLWVPLTLLSAGLGGASVLAIGVSGVLAGKATRRVGAVLALVGVGWVIVLGQLGAIAGNGYIVNWYAYLTGPTRHIGPIQILVGVLGHPTSALRIVASRWDLVFLFLSTVGVVGVVWPWALPTALVVIGPSALNSNAYFLQARAAFQTWPVLPVVLVGTIVVLMRLATSSAPYRRAVRFVLVGWAAALVPLGAAGIADLPTHWLAVDSEAAAEIGRIEQTVPPNAELVASQGIIGRLTSVSEVYDFWTISQTIPITRRRVYFVLSPSQGASPTPTWQTRRAIRFISDQLHAETIATRSGVFEFEWRPPPTIRSLRLS
jgi:hypothetical protein